MTKNSLSLSYSDIKYYSWAARSGSLRGLVRFRSVLAQNTFLSLSFSDIQYYFRYFFAGGASRRQRTLCLCHIRILYIISGQIPRRRFVPPIRRRRNQNNLLYLDDIMIPLPALTSRAICWSPPGQPPAALNPDWIPIESRLNDSRPVGVDFVLQQWFPIGFCLNSYTKSKTQAQC